jgi:hypothetical protein
LGREDLLCQKVMVRKVMVSADEDATWQVGYIMEF